MSFNSNDYPLSREYQNRIQNTVSRQNRAAELDTKTSSQYDLRRPRLVLIGLAIGVILILAFLSTDVALAQDESPIFDPGGDGKTATEWFNLGVWYIGQQKYEKAVVELTVAIDLYPDFGSAYAARGVSQYHLGQYDDAIADYTAAIMIFPGYASVYNYRGMAYLALGHVEQAVADAQRAALLDAGYAHAHWTLGSAYMEAEDFAAAQASFERYIVLAGVDADPDAAQMIALCEAQLQA